MPIDPPELETVPARRPLRMRLSIVWLVPLMALVIAVGLAIQSWLDRGPLIEIVFEEASGIAAGVTELRYRDVTVGKVEELDFLPDLSKVAVHVRLNSDIADYVDDDAVFWVVKPEVTASGVSGLDTVLSGVFIEGIWDHQAEGLVASHEGQPRPPLLYPGQDGIVLQLRALPGVALAANSPILYKGIEVGKLGEPELSADGAAAIAPAAIYAPYNRLVQSTTRFWDTSGFSFSIGTGGAELDFSSISSLIAGGISFDTTASGGRPASDRDMFDVFASQRDARSDIFVGGRGEGVPFSIIFDDNVSGLEIGAAVELLGLQVGEVTAITGLVDMARFGDRRVRMLVSVELRPSELQLASLGSADTAVQDFVAQQVRDGLRARLVSSGLLSTGLKVEFLTVEGAPEAELDETAEPHPLIPATQSEISDATASAQGALQRLSDLPIEELMQSAVRFLDNASGLVQDTSRIVQDDALRAIPGDMRTILGDVREVVAAPAVQGLPQQAGRLMEELNAAVGDLRDVIRQIDEARAIERLMSAIDAAGAAAQSAQTGLEGMPELMTSLNETAQTARDLPLDALVARTSALLEQAETLLAQPGTRSLPERLGAALDEMRLAISELRAGGAVASVNDTMASASAAARAVEQAAAELPAISDRVQRLLAQASSTLAGYDQNSELNRSARATLTALSRAADAIQSLARALERRPNSIILGR